MIKEEYIEHLTFLKSRIGQLEQHQYHFEELRKLLTDEICRQENESSYYFKDLNRTLDKQLDNYIKATNKSDRQIEYESLVWNFKSDVSRELSRQRKNRN